MIAGMPYGRPPSQYWQFTNFHCSYSHPYMIWKGALIFWQYILMKKANIGYGGLCMTGNKRIFPKNLGKWLHLLSFLASNYISLGSANSIVLLVLSFPACFLIIHISLHNFNVSKQLSNVPILLIWLYYIHLTYLIIKLILHTVFFQNKQFYLRGIVMCSSLYS